MRGIEHSLLQRTKYVKRQNYEKDEGIRILAQEHGKMINEKTQIMWMTWQMYRSSDKRRDIWQLHLQEWNLVHHTVPGVVIVAGERVVLSDE